MSILQVIVLAVIQGLTEFLPVSSSAHLILPSVLLSWPDQGLAFDVAVHVGTLAAVVTYFRKDLLQMCSAWLGDSIRFKTSSDSRLLWYVGFATVPAGLAGLVFDDFIEQHLRSIVVIATTTMFFGLLLGVADKYSSKALNLKALTGRQALIIGCAQALALVPGTSRSGITMTAALALGFDRVAAARFSFLLSIPIIALSGGYKSLELALMNNVPWFEISVATLLSAVTAYACIHTFLALVNRLGMMPFVWYRLALGAVLFVMLAAGFTAT
jgi:undecaprenyl-diphosphatase